MGAPESPLIIKYVERTCMSWALCVGLPEHQLISHKPPHQAQLPILLLQTVPCLFEARGGRLFSQGHRGRSVAHAGLRHQHGAGRKPVRQRKKPGRWIKGSRRRDPRASGKGGPEPSGSEEKRELDPRPETGADRTLGVRRRKGPEPREEEGARPAGLFGPRRGGARKDPPRRAAPPPVYLCPVPGAASFPILTQVTSEHDLSPRCRDTASASARVAPPWLCSRDPSMPPARLRAHRACALHSRLLSSAEAAAASPFRRHGVSNRSSLRLQLPFPPFRSSRPSRPGLRGGVGRRE